MKSRVEAFAHALRGGRTLLVTQPHARFHLAATCAVLVLGFLCRVSLQEWVILIICIASVWAAEAVNTSIEFLADEVSLERRDRIKHAKDIAAFAVLAASAGSAIAGAIIFVTHFLKSR